MIIGKIINNIIHLFAIFVNGIRYNNSNIKSNNYFSKSAPHNQRKGVGAKPLQRQTYLCGHRLWSNMWSSNFATATFGREYSIPPIFPPKKAKNKAENDCFRLYLV